MATGTTTLTQVPAGVDAYYDRKLLERARPLLVFNMFGQTRPLPQGSSKVIRFRKYSALTVASSISEGVAPDADQLAVTDITATVVQYGAFVKLTDVVQMVIEDKILNEAMELLSDQMAVTLDGLTSTVLKAGSNVVYSNGIERVTLASKITSTAFESAIRTLKRNNAMPFTEIVKSSTGVGTLPIRPAYWAFVHPDLIKDLESLTDFTSVERYASQGPVHEGEVGAYKNIRFISTTVAPTAAAGGAVYDGTYVSDETTKNDVYQIVIIAKNAYGITELERASVSSIVKTPGPQDTSNPLDQYSTVGWKAWHVAKILNDAWMVRIETCATV